MAQVISSCPWFDQENDVDFIGRVDSKISNFTKSETQTFTNHCQLAHQVKLNNERHIGQIYMSYRVKMYILYMGTI